MTLNDPEQEAVSSESYGSCERARPSTTTRRLARVFGDGLCFGNYQIVRLIAIGGMSEVYEAIHVGLNKRVALKVIRPDLAENPEARQRFISEGVNAASIRHSNVVDVTDVGVFDELPFLVMALLDGEDLGMIYDRQGRIPVPELIDLLLPVASAVSAGHAKGVVHRDLKPDNIFLHREGARVVPKVLDFGVSRVMSARRITVNASVFGTPHYMSPEQARGAGTDARTDQYALGVILYEGVTGHLPRDSSNPIELLHSVAYDSFRPPSDHFELPPELEAVILRAMAADPDERFASMRDMALALVPFASEGACEYWSVELGSSSDEQSGEARVTLAARHPSLPPPMPVRALMTTTGRARVQVTGSVPAVAPRTRSAARPQQLRAASAPRPAIRAEQAAFVDEAVMLAAEGRGRPRGYAWSVVGVSAMLAMVGAWLVTGVARVEAPAAALPAAGRGATHVDLDVKATPSTAALILDGNQVGIGHYAGRVRVDGSLHELLVEADGFTSQSVSFRDSAPAGQISLTPAAPTVAALSVARDEPSGPVLPEEASARDLASDELSSPALPEETSAPAVQAKRAYARRWMRMAQPSDSEPARVAAGRPAQDPLSAPDSPAASARMTDSEPQQPVVRIVDERQPRVRLVE